jgi:UDP-glucuronate 4-epimerase
VPQTWANVEKAGRLLGYAPTTPFDKGVARFVEWLGRSRDDGGSAART